MSSKFKDTLMVPVTEVIEFDSDHVSNDDVVANAISDAARYKTEAERLVSSVGWELGAVSPTNARVEVIPTYGVTWATRDESIYQTGYIFETYEEAEKVALDGPWRTMQLGEHQVDHMGYVKNGDMVFGMIQTEGANIHEVQVGEYVEMNVGFITSADSTDAAIEVRDVLEAHETFTWDNRDLVVDLSS